MPTRKKNSERKFRRNKIQIGGKVEPHEIDNLITEIEKVEASVLDLRERILKDPIQAAAVTRLSNLEKGKSSTERVTKKLRDIKFNALPYPPPPDPGQLINYQHDKNEDAKTRLRLEQERRLAGLKPEDLANLKKITNKQEQAPAPAPAPVPASLLEIMDEANHPAVTASVPRSLGQHNKPIDYIKPGELINPEDTSTDDDDEEEYGNIIGDEWEHAFDGKNPDIGLHGFSGSKDELLAVIKNYINANKFEGHEYGAWISTYNAINKFKNDQQIINRLKKDKIFFDNSNNIMSGNKENAKNREKPGFHVGGKGTRKVKGGKHTKKYQKKNNQKSNKRHNKTRYTDQKEK